MKMTRKELDAALADLAIWVPAMIEETDEGSQIDAFAGHVEALEERVAPEDHDHYWSATQCILRDNGLVPGDDEPCEAS